MGVYSGIEPPSDQIKDLDLVDESPISSPRGFKTAWRDKAYQDWLNQEGSLCPPGSGDDRG
jgi:hypothetical protein